MKLKGTKRAKIRKNDQVIVIAGRDKGKRARVLAVAPTKGKVKVEGAGMIKRHQKPAGNRSIYADMRLTGLAGRRDFPAE